MIEAQTQTGDYTVWLDPSRGYTMARALVQRHFGHLRPNGRPFEKGESSVFFVEKVRWEQRQDVWVPVEATGGQTATEPGKAASRQGWHFKLTRFELNPDHTALRSFVPDDVLDKAKFTLTGPRGHDLQGTWQNGRAVDAKGNVFWNPDSLGGAATNKPPEDDQTGGTDKPMSAGPEVKWRGGSVFMKRLLLISLCGWFAVSTWAATNYPPLTATELLDKFAAGQEQLLSMAYTATTTEEGKTGNRYYCCPGAD